MDFSIIGIKGYYFDLKPSGGKLRSQPEDFYVEEVVEGLEKKDEGNTLVLKLRAKNWEHNRLIRFVARIYHVSQRRVYFSGTKDRRSVKVQYLSIPGVKYRAFNLVDVEVLDHFYLDAPLTVGSHSKNLFRIRVEGADERVFLTNCREVSAKKVIPNFYGPQRFGPLRPVTHLVGREIVKGNFSGAVNLFIGYPGEDRFADLRKEYIDNPDPKVGLEKFPKSLDLERKVMEHLLLKPGDYSGAIKVLPDNLVSMFVHAYQGYVFNKILSRRLELHTPILPGDIYRFGDKTVRVNSINIERIASSFERGVGSPTGLVVGSRVDLAGGKMGEIEDEVLKEEGIRQNDFKIPFGLNSNGERRDLFFRPEDFEFDGSTVKFSLPPGAYATSVMREIMRVDEMANY